MSPRGYKTPQPAITAFREADHQDVIRRMHERLDNLEEATGMQSFNQGRKSPAPARAQLQVTANAAMPGHFFVRITNPEFLGAGRNALGVPLRHWLEAAPTPQFNQGVVDFGISHQTYWTITELGSGTFHFRIRSSADGKTFNNPAVSGPVSS